MRTFLFLLLWSYFCYAGTPGHETIVHCDFGCIEVQTSDYVAHDICERRYTKISPDADGMYRLTIFSGYPLGRAHDRRSMPRYKQDYVWGEDYYRVSLDAKNCLRVAPLALIALDLIGQCPPSSYRDDDLVRNPYYYVYGPGQTEGFNMVSPTAFDLGDDNFDLGDASTLIPSQGSSSLFSFGDEGLEAGDGLSLSSPGEDVLSSSDDSLFLADSGLSDISFAPSDLFDNWV